MALYKATENGLVPAKMVENPQNVDWGCIFIRKNGKVVHAYQFDSDDDFKRKVTFENKSIVNRKDRGNRYEILPFYGKSVWDMYPRVSGQITK